VRGSSRVIDRYLLAGMAGPSLVALCLIAGLVFALQLLRLGHHLAGAGAGALLVGRALLYSLPSLAVFTLPIALFAGILFSLGQRAEEGELTALRSFGASPLRLAAPAALLAVVGALAAYLLGAFVEPVAAARLRDELVRGAARALLLGAEAGRFHPLGGGAVLYAERRPRGDPRVALFEGFLLEAPRPSRALLLARRARLALEADGSARLGLEEGELQELTPEGGLRRVRFRALEDRLDVQAVLGRHLGFLGRVGSTADGVVVAPSPHARQAALSCIALALLAAALGLLGERGGRLRRVLLGLLLLALYEGGCVLLAEVSTVQGAVEGLAVVATCLAGVSLLGGRRALRWGRRGLAPTGRRGEEGRGGSPD
jgi:lipopolysaccharide export LptBFGC system permease protein LptF